MLPYGNQPAWGTSPPIQASMGHFPYTNLPNTASSGPVFYPYYAFATQPSQPYAMAAGPGPHSLPYTNHGVRAPVPGLAPNTTQVTTHASSTQDMYNEIQRLKAEQAVLIQRLQDESTKPISATQPNEASSKVAAVTAPPTKTVPVENTGKVHSREMQPSQAGGKGDLKDAAQKFSQLLGDPMFLSSQAYREDKLAKMAELGDAREFIKSLDFSNLINVLLGPEPKLPRRETPIRSNEAYNHRSNETYNQRGPPHASNASPQYKKSWDWNSSPDVAHNRNNNPMPGAPSGFRGERNVAAVGHREGRGGYGGGGYQGSRFGDHDTPGARRHDRSGGYSTNHSGVGGGNNSGPGREGGGYRSGDRVGHRVNWVPPPSDNGWATKRTNTKGGGQHDGAKRTEVSASYESAWGATNDNNGGWGTAADNVGQGGDDQWGNAGGSSGWDVPATGPASGWDVPATGPSSGWDVPSKNDSSAPHAASDPPPASNGTAWGTDTVTTGVPKLALKEDGTGGTATDDSSQTRSSAAVEGGQVTSSQTHVERLYAASEVVAPVPAGGTNATTTTIMSSTASPVLERSAHLADATGEVPENRENIVDPVHHSLFFEEMTGMPARAATPRSKDELPEDPLPFILKLKSATTCTADEVITFEDWLTRRGLLQPAPVGPNEARIKTIYYLDPAQLYIPSHVASSQPIFALNTHAEPFPLSEFELGIPERKMYTRRYVVHPRSTRPATGLLENVELLGFRPLAYTLPEDTIRMIETEGGLLHCPAHVALFVISYYLGNLARLFVECWREIVERYAYQAWNIEAIFKVEKYAATETNLDRVEITAHLSFMRAALLSTYKHHARLVELTNEVAHELLRRGVVVSSIVGLKDINAYLDRVRIEHWGLNSVSIRPFERFMAPLGCDTTLPDPATLVPTWSTTPRRTLTSVRALNDVIMKPRRDGEGPEGAPGHAACDVKPLADSHRQYRANRVSMIQKGLRKKLLHVFEVDPAEREKMVPGINSLIGEEALLDEYELYLKAREDGTFMGYGRKTPGHAHWHHTVLNRLSEHEREVDNDIHMAIRRYRGEYMDYDSPDLDADEYGLLYDFAVAAWYPGKPTLEAAAPAGADDKTAD